MPITSLSVSDRVPAPNVTGYLERLASCDSEGIVIIWTLITEVDTQGLSHLHQTTGKVCVPCCRGTAW